MPICHVQPTYTHLPPRPAATLHTVPMFGTWKYDPETDQVQNLRRAFDPVTARSSQHQACNRCHLKKVMPDHVPRRARVPVVWFVRADRPTTSSNAVVKKRVASAASPTTSSANTLVLPPRSPAAARGAVRSRLTAPEAAAEAPPRSARSSLVSPARQAREEDVPLAVAPRGVNNPRCRVRLDHPVKPKERVSWASWTFLS